MLVREGPDELTLRSEKVRTQKSCMNVDHIAKERWSPPLVDADRLAFWIMKAAKDRREHFNEPERKDNILGKMKHDWNRGASTSKTRLWHSTLL